MLRHLEAQYPHEGCGVILRRAGAFRVLPLPNVYDRYHALDPGTYPRSARSAYLVDPGAWLRLNQEAEAEGEEICCLFHSHADASAHFSAEDRQLAAPYGEPLFPGLAYLVVAVEQGRAGAARVYRWFEGQLLEFAVL